VGQAAGFANMSQVHGLSDQQVELELRKMTAFIRQEALEKAREIEIKANEEFAIEKSKLVRQETDAIDAQYDKKFKQARMSQQVTRSTLANKMRLRVLAARQELVDDIFEAARSRLADGLAEKARYQSVLRGLIREGIVALNESAVQVRARKADYDLVRKAADEACKALESSSAKVSVKLMESNPLPEGSAGGVIIYGGAGKIDVDNTFEARLRLLEESALPAIRETLFGKNPNRRFTD